MAKTFFDTREYINRLVRSGVPTLQAEAHSLALGQIMHSELASKADLKEMSAELRGEFNDRFSRVDMEFARIRGEFNDRFSRVDIDFARIRGEFALLKWMLGFLLAGMTAMLLKIFQ